MSTVILMILWGTTLNLSGKKIDNSLQKYFEIKGEQIEYQGNIHKNIYPVIAKTTDSISLFMNKYSRRFEYVVMNKTGAIFRDSTFQNLFPDTIQMSKIYCEKLGNDKATLTYLNAFINPCKEGKKHLKYTQLELMEVASRFFLCDRINPDTTIFWHVCIGINGQNEAGWLKDFTLLEAFCFEAIFDGLQSNNREKSVFMNNFINYVGQAETTYKDLPFELMLERSKNAVFKKMENDPDLQTLLLDYYNQTKHKLPFDIQQN